MSGTDFVSGRTLGAVYASEESSFCTAGTEVRCYPVAGSVEIQRMQAEINVSALRPRPWDAQDPVLGDKSATAKATFYLQPPTTRLDSSASSSDYADAACPSFTILRCLIGGLSAAVGTSVETGVTPSAASGATVEGTQGARLPSGQLCLLTDPDAAVGLVPARILTRSTDAVTWWPSLSGAPADESAIVVLPTFYPTRTNTRSLSLALAPTQASSRQELLNGGTGSLSLTFERDGLATFAVDLAFAQWTGPSSQSYLTTHAADPMAAPLACRTATLYLQAQATATRVNYVVDAAAVTLNLGNAHVKTLTGGTNGVRGVIRKENLNAPALEMELTGPDDSQIETWWSARTELSAMLFVTADYSGGRRCIVLDVPRAIIVGTPERSDGDGALTKMKWKLVAHLDDTTSGGGVELAEAPWRLGIGG